MDYICAKNNITSSYNYLFDKYRELLNKNELYNLFLGEISSENEIEKDVSFIGISIAKISTIFGRTKTKFVEYSDLSMINVLLRETLIELFQLNEKIDALLRQLSEKHPNIVKSVFLKNSNDCIRKYSDLVNSQDFVFISDSPEHEFLIAEINSFNDRLKRIVFSQIESDENLLLLLNDIIKQNLIMEEMDSFIKYCWWLYEMTPAELLSETKKH